MKSEDVPRHIFWRRLRLFLALAVWVLVSFQLWQKEIYQPVTTAVHRRISPDHNRTIFTQYLRFSAAGKEIGQSAMLLMGSPKGQTLRDQSQLELPQLGTLGSFTLLGEAHLGQRSNLEDFRYYAQAGGMQWEARGLAKADILTVTAAGPGVSFNRAFVLPKTGAEMAQAVLPLAFIDDPPQPHTARTITTFDVLQGGLKDAVLTMGEKKLMPYGAAMEDAVECRMSVAGTDLISWITTDGHILLQTSNLGYDAKRVSRQELFFSASRRQQATLFDPSVCAPFAEGTWLGDASRLNRLVVRWLGEGVRRFVDSGERRRWLDQDQAVMEFRNELPGPPVPPPWANASAVPDASLVQTVKSILSYRQVGNNPANGIRRIVDWLGDNVRPVPSLTRRAPAEILAAKEANAHELVGLCAQLLSAAGYRYQPYFGLVYETGGFFYRPWLNVGYGDDSWWVDPVSQQVPADLTHLPLWLNREPEHRRLMLSLSTLDLEVLNADYVGGKHMEKEGGWSAK